MAGDGRLPGENDVVPQLGAARDAGLRDEDAIVADLHVVRNLHQVINLRALADDRRAERATIHGHIRADFDVVADDHIADLRHLAMNGAVKHVTKSIRADDRARMDANSFADL